MGLTKIIKCAGTIVFQLSEPSTFSMGHRATVRTQRLFRSRAGVNLVPLPCPHCRTPSSVRGMGPTNCPRFPSEQCELLGSSVNQKSALLNFPIGPGPALQNYKELVQFLFKGTKMAIKSLLKFPFPPSLLFPPSSAAVIPGLLKEAVLTGAISKVHCSYKDSAWLPTSAPASGRGPV